MASSTLPPFAVRGAQRMQRPATLAVQCTSLSATGTLVYCTCFVVQLDRLCRLLSGRFPMSSSTRTYCTAAQRSFGLILDPLLCFYISPLARIRDTRFLTPFCCSSLVLV